MLLPAGQAQNPANLNTRR